MVQNAKITTLYQEMDVQTALLMKNGSVILVKIILVFVNFKMYAGIKLHEEMRYVIQQRVVLTIALKYQDTIARLKTGSLHVKHDVEMESELLSMKHVTMVIQKVMMDVRRIVHQWR